MTTTRELSDKNNTQIITQFKRELFAGLAMHGLLSWGEVVRDNKLDVIANSSVELADALIKSLNKEKKS